jgi:hypothetical protein
MLPQLAQILQDTLNFTRYAASPFVLNGRPDSIRQWLSTLREQLVAVVAKVDHAITALGAASERTDADWTDEERVLSHQWVTRFYPNEPEAVQVALREAWRDGQRMRSAHPDTPPGSGGRELNGLPCSHCANSCRTTPETGVGSMLSRITSTAYQLFGRTDTWTSTESQSATSFSGTG